MDVAKHIAYWRKGAEEDWEVACHLVERDKVRQGLFFAHLALEKALKAHVCRETEAVPPKIHNLARLAELSGLQITEEQSRFLGDMNKYCMIGRYPEMLPDEPLKSDAEKQLEKMKDIYQWLIQRL